MITVLLSSLLVAAPAGAGASPDLFSPNLHIGETLRYKAEVRSSGILGESREHVMTAEIDARVVHVDVAGYTFALAMRNGPLSAPEQQITFRRNGDIVDTDGKPLQNHLTAGPLYDAFFFGAPPARIETGASWNVTLDRPWQYGPAGTAAVTVAAVDAQAHAVELRVSGSGSGTLGESLDQDRVTTEMGGRTASVIKAPQRSKWTAVLHLRDGVVVDETTTVQTEWRVAASSLSPATTFIEKRTSTLKLIDGLK